MRLNATRERIESAVEAREAELSRAELDRRLSEERVDVTLPVGGDTRGRLHLITQIRREVEDVFLGLGYGVVDGREVETTRYNFDALNFPAGHPARSPLATLFLDDETVLRTETSPSQIRTMEVQEPPVYIVTLGRVLPARHARRDPHPDLPPGRGARGRRGDHARRPHGHARLPPARRSSATQTPHASSGRTTSRSPSRRSRRTSPATSATASGCPVCRHSGWIEVGGAGMVDPKLFEFVGYDPERYTGFAFGWGLERIAMLRHEFPDLRELWRNDLRFSRQF